MKIDIHTHTSERSACGRSPGRELIEAARDFGLDGIVLTDHHRHVPPVLLAELNRDFAPFRVFGGIEVTVTEGEDIIVIGPDDPALEERKWTYPDLHLFLRECGGFMSMAHPFRYTDQMRIDVIARPPDAMEIHSVNTGACDETAIRTLCDRTGCPGIHVSDAHEAGHAGIYHIDLEGSPPDAPALAALLRQGVYRNCADPVRIAARNAEVEAWESRIRAAIAEGRDRRYYIEVMGGKGGHFDRVALGRSYRV